MGADVARIERLTRRRFNARLFRWHDLARRPIAIREAASPWETLVGEVMSQQTGIERVGPAWRSFVERWPTPATLAAADTRDLLAAWSGLGYNRRALALREAARRIIDTHDGRVPASVESLELLPGVGPYTARAVAAAAFGAPVAPLDVNVKRVASRVVGGTLSAAQLQVAADGLVSRARPGQWVDAVMDLAVTVCTRRAPRCTACPVAALCASRGAIGSAEPRRMSPRFASTTRWLRGRLVAAMLDAPRGAWVAMPDRLGEHDANAVRHAARALATEGFLEIRDGFARLRRD